MKPQIVSLNGITPRIHPSAWIAPGAVIAGNVEIGPEVGIWYGAVIRSEYTLVKIGAKSNLQDNVILHSDPFMPVDALIIGEEVSVGHGAILHHCNVGNRALVGMGSIVLNGSTLEDDSVVAAGTLVSMHTTVPQGAMIVGNPGKIRRNASQQEKAAFAQGMRFYCSIRDLHRDPGLRRDFDINI